MRALLLLDPGELVPAVQQISVPDGNGLTRDRACLGPVVVAQDGWERGGPALLADRVRGLNRDVLGGAVYDEGSR